MPFNCKIGTVEIIEPSDLGGLNISSVRSIADSPEGLLVTIEGEVDGLPVSVRYCFDHVRAYCVSNEGQRIVTAQRLVSETGPAGVLHRIRESAWLEQFRIESDHTVDREPLEHFLLVTGDDWVDVIGTEPSVRLNR